MFGANASQHPELQIDAKSHLTQINYKYLSDIREHVISFGFPITRTIFKGINADFCNFLCDCTSDQLMRMAEFLPPIAGLSSESPRL